eukprot:TRINITY_DN76119_c0_g1_i1.p1 TRINITY_DN76119_c0_g1~~TRINITY_DN76119_c0_g1_i1.p1  ORF type:complete len:510 (-),score=62.83 TRINITY_DN76119_c0_g1_i1:309-1769(-)
MWYSERAGKHCHGFCHLFTILVLSSSCQKMPAFYGQAQLCRDSKLVGRPHYVRRVSGSRLLTKRCGGSKYRAKSRSLQVTVGLAKGMVGSGVLSLASGVAAFTASQQGLQVAIALLLGMTLLSAYTFQIVAEVSEETDASDLSEAWAASVGKKTAWVPRLCVCTISAVTCIVYSMLLGDLLSAVIRASFGQSLESFPWISRGPVLAVLTLTVLLPLCLAKDYSSLSFTSSLGLVACFYMAAFTAWRCFDGSYIPGGRFFSLAPQAPAALVPAKQVSEVMNLRTLVHLSTCSMMYCNHGMVPSAYRELTSPMQGSPREKLCSFAAVTTAAFAVAGGLALTLMSSGFSTFGSRTNSLLLASYATSDVGATVARLAVFFSVLFGFPLNFVLLRKEVECALGRSALSNELLTFSLLAGISCLAVLIKDLGKIQAAAGASTGSFIVFVAPALMERGLRRARGTHRRRWLERSLCATGLLLAVLGLTITLVS